MKSLSMREAFKLVPLSRKTPSELTFITTTACNFRCRHCFMIDELNERADELTSDEMRLMAPYMPKMRRVHLGGGEPFVRADIANKALVASSEWRSEVICIPTNGWYKKNIVDTIRLFGDNADGQLRIHFSINTMPENMDAFTGVKGSFARWRESIGQALELADRYDNVTIVCLVTYNEDNKDRFAELKSFIVNEIRPNDFSLQLARNHDKYQADLDTEEFDAVVRDYFRNDSKQPWFLTAYRELIRERTSACKNDAAVTPNCGSGTSRIVIAPNGDVYPCETKGYPNGGDYTVWRMGNIRDYAYNINALLASPQAQAIRERIASELCRCEHGIDIAMSLMTSPTFPARVLRRGLEHALHRAFSK